MGKTLKYYLAAYNFVAFVFWALYLVYFIVSGLRIDIYGIWFLNIAQGLALFEIFHALMKWVKSPVMSTIAQVASRLLVVILIDNAVSDMIVKGFMYMGSSVDTKVTYTGIIIVSFAWSITELVRYSLYFLSLLNRQPEWLVWMRYTFFIGLYPLGVAGEWMIFLAPLFLAGLTLSGYTLFVGFLLLAYAYYFPVLSRYMWKQRKAKLG